MRALYEIGEVAVEMSVRSTATIEVEASVCAFPLQKYLWLGQLASIVDKSSSNIKTHIVLSLHVFGVRAL